MKVEFTITLENAVVNDLHIDQLILRWTNELDQQEILEISHQWLTSKNFLTGKMLGLSRVGESSLLIEPFEDTPDINILF